MVPILRLIDATVPAFFDDQQRQATREAAMLAGLTVDRIINEPTAATLVYHAGTHDRKHVAVYDFGGGTFDVSIVRMEGGVTEVLASHGDVHLGGDDLDQKLMDDVASQFQEQHGIDLRANPQARYRLLMACERAKCQLSSDESTDIAEEFIAEKDGQPLHLSTRISRAKFEDLIRTYVDRTIQSVDTALRDAGLTVHQIDDLVLVGGSTRIPLVEQRLRDEFLREPSRSVDPDLAVALGAAVQAAMIQGEAIGPVLVDVCAHTLGIEALGDEAWFTRETVTTPIIHRNTPLPARYEELFFTSHDDQDMAIVHVLQGERREVHRNRSIGKFELPLEPGGGERKRIVVRFELTLDGTLKVTATQPATGKTQDLTITNALSQFQAEERVEVQERLQTMFAASEELMDESMDVMLETVPPAADETTGVAVRFPEAATLLRKAHDSRASIQGPDADDLEALCRNLKDAMDRDDALAVADLSAELDDLLFYVQ